jgi:hypothetical protein
VQKKIGKTAFCAVTNDLTRTVLNSSTFSIFMTPIVYVFEMHVRVLNFRNMDLVLYVRNKI